MIGSRRGITDGVAAATIRRFIHKDDSLRDQPFVGRSGVIGEGADDFAVVVAVIGEAVGFDDRPVGEVGEQDVGRIVDAVLFLGAGAAAQIHVAAAENGVAADVVIGVDQDHGGAILSGLNRGGQAGGAGSDDHDVRFAVPAAREWDLRGQRGERRRGAYSHAGGGGCTDAGGGGLDEITSRELLWFRRIFHWCLP